MEAQPTGSLKKSASELFNILQEPDEAVRNAKLRSSLTIIRAESEPQPRASATSGSDHHEEGSVHDWLSGMLGELYIPYNWLAELHAIGEGGFAHVHKATLTYPGGLKQVVAVKCLRADRVQDDEQLNEFIMEANLWRKLRSKDIVKLVGIGAKDLSSLATVKNTLYIVCEYMDGGTLQHMVTRQMMSTHKNTYSFSDAFRWFVDISRAIKYLHSCKPAIVHRDVKLENVLLTSKDNSANEAKILDLGLHMRQRRPNADSGDSGPDTSYYGGNLYDSFLANGSVHPRTSGEPTLADKVRAVEGANDELSMQFTPPQSTRTKHGGANMLGLMTITEEQDSKTPEEIDAMTKSSSAKPPAQQTADDAVPGENHTAAGKHDEVAEAPEAVQSASPQQDTSGRSSNVLHTRKVGSYMYMAPEMVSGHKYSEAVDVFSVTVMLYEVLRGRLNVLKIAVGGDASEVMGYAEKIAAGFREEVPSNWPEEVKALLRDGWHQDPSMRINIGEMFNRLNALIAAGVPGSMDVVVKERPKHVHMDCGCSVQ